MAVMRRHKIAAAGAVLAVAALALTGCSGSTNGASSCSTPTEISWLGTIKVEIQDQFKAAIDTYNSTNKDCVKVNLVDSPQGTPFLQIVTPLYAAKKAPTIMTALQELPDMADKVIDWTNEPLAKLALGGTLDVANINGKQVGIPITAEAFGLLYNKDVLDKAGVDPAAIKTEGDLKAAFDKVKATGVDAIHFSGLWWSLGAHFTNIYHTTAAKTAPERLAILDKLKAGSYDLSKDAAFTTWLDTFDLFKQYNIKTASIADTDYDAGVADLSSGKAGFWFMGNWAEPNLLTAKKDGKFGIMPVPVGTSADYYGNDSISVGVPFYAMIDKEQSTQAQQDAAKKVLSWFITTPDGQAKWSGPVADGGMSFIPVYKGFTVKPATLMAQQIAQYIADGKTLQWVNSKYPSGLQDKYGAAAQKYYAGKSDRAAFAKDLQDSWTSLKK